MASLPIVGADQAEQAHGGIPKAQLTQRFHKAKDKTPEESCEMLQGPMTEDLLQAAVTKNFSNQLTVSELESNLQETSGETPRNITVETNHSPRGEWPSWSLPPPEENLRKENAEKNSTCNSESIFCLGFCMGKALLIFYVFFKIWSVDFCF